MELFPDEAFPNDSPEDKVKSKPTIIFIIHGLESGLVLDAWVILHCTDCHVTRHYI